MKYLLKNINEETAIAIADFFILNRSVFPHIILLNGEIGVGKTTFSHAYITKMNMSVAFSSPTYTIVNEYEFEDRIINHFDLYRITTDDYDWIYEYLDQEEQFFLFEWASLHQELFQEYQFIEITIVYNESDTRDYFITVNDENRKELEEFFNETGIIFEKCINTSDC